MKNGVLWRSRRGKRTACSGGADGTASPDITDIAVTVVEGEHGAHLNPLEARTGLGAFFYHAPRSSSMAEVASDREVAAAVWWSRMRRSGPCSAARLSPRRWLGRVGVVGSAPTHVLVVAHGRGARVFMSGWPPCGFE